MQTSQGVAFTLFEVSSGCPDLLGSGLAGDYSQTIFTIFPIDVAVEDKTAPPRLSMVWRA